MYRVLKPAGSPLIADYGKKDPPRRNFSQVLFERKENLLEHFAGRIPEHIKETGFSDLSEGSYQAFSIWSARKPA